MQQFEDSKNSEKRANKDLLRQPVTAMRSSAQSVKQNKKKQKLEKQKLEERVVRRLERINDKIGRN